MSRRLLSIGLLFFVLFLCMPAGCRAQSARTKYTIEGSYSPETSTLTATLALDYRNDTGVPLTELCFQLYGNAYREGARYAPLSAAYHSAYYGKMSYGEMQIASVSGARAWEVAGEDRNLLVVTVDELSPGRRLALSIGFTVKLAAVNHRLGVGETCVNLGNFYPILCVYDDGWQSTVYYATGDPFFSACADYEVTLTFPDRYVLASSGTQIGSSVKGGYRTVTAELQNARDFAAVLSEGFSVRERTIDGTSILYYCTDEANAEAYLAVAKESFAYYARTFGAYPYETLSIVQTDFCFGGMEYPGLVMINRDLVEETYLYTIAHEIAHQWWYAAVGSDPIRHAWMDEGLAEYSCVLFFEGHDYGYTRSGVVASAKRALRAYASLSEQLFGKKDMAIDRPLSAFSSEYEYSNLVYNGGILLFDCLREAIGDKRFLGGLNEYYTAYAGEIAAPEDLKNCFRKLGADVDGLFSSFLNGNGLI